MTTRKKNIDEKCMFVHRFSLEGSITLLRFEDVRPSCMGNRGHSVMHARTPNLQEHNELNTLLQNFETLYFFFFHS